MKTEIIFKRECGARVKIEHELLPYSFRTISTVSVSVALKCKRKFLDIPSKINPNAYMPIEHRKIIELGLHQVTDEEIRQVKEKTLEEIRKQIM